jgi:hypothetical protein
VTREEFNKETGAGGILDSVAARLRLPFGAPDFIDKIATGTVNEVGRRTLYVLVTTWDAAEGGPFVASAIGTAGVSKIVDTIEDLFLNAVFGKALKALGADDIKLRASLCASTLVGLGMMRYVATADPIASMEVDEIVDVFAPTLQRYLIGDLTE